MVALLRPHSMAYGPAQPHFYGCILRPPALHGRIFATGLCMAAFCDHVLKPLALHGRFFLRLYSRA